MHTENFVTISSVCLLDNNVWRAGGQIYGEHSEIFLIRDDILFLTKAFIIILYI